MTQPEDFSPSGREVEQGHEPGCYYPSCSEEPSQQVIAGGIHTGRFERSTETNSLDCRVRAFKQSDDVPCNSNEAGPSGMERSSLAVDTLKTAKTGTTSSTPPRSIFSCPRAHSLSSSFSNPAPKQAPLTSPLCHSNVYFVVYTIKLMTYISRICGPPSTRPPETTPIVCRIFISRICAATLRLCLASV